MKSISILKHNLMRAAMTLALIVTCAAAWAQNPNLADYTFTTGQDASKWITLSDNATQMIGSGVDDAPSALTSIGFDFPFGDGTYSQFWTNPNGIFSFNSSPANSYKLQFHSDGNQYQANQPKICGISADMSTGNNGYVKYEMTGTAPNRVFVCEFFLRGWTSTTTPANIKWQVHLHEANAKVVMVYGVSDPDLNSNQIGLSQSGSDIWTINPSTHEATHSTGAVTSTNPVNTWPGTYRYYEFNPPVPSDFTDNGDGTYTIYTATGWGVFCDMLDNGESFSGKTVKLGADIGTTTSPITRMACDEDHKFKGTFDGQGHTLTVNYSGSELFIAPFRVVSDTPTFRNLTVDGTINSANDYASGLIGELYGDITVEDCTSLVEISCQENKGGAAGFVGLCKNAVTFTDCVSNAVIHSAGSNNGGFVGYSWSNVNGGNHAMSFTGCVFNGKLLQINGSGTHNGGFIGWKGENQILTITNSLVDPAALAEGENYASNNSGTFARGWNNNATALNSYYTTAFGAAQGKQAHSITAGQNVTSVANAGTATTYATSGITSYGTGIKYNNVLYAGENDQVSLTLNHSEAPTGYTFTGYTANAGTLNGTTLTMPNADVTISATMTANTYYVHFDGNGSTGGSMNNQSFTYDMAQNLTANAFTLTGYHFIGWNTQANGGGTSYTDGQEVINLTATNNGTVTLYAQWTLAVVPVTYLDMNGTQQQCNSYILLTGNMNNLGTYGQETWYVADGNVTFSNTINVANGNVHIILKDNAVMNVGTEQSPISEHGIYVYNNKSLNIYAQSTGADKGRLNVYATTRGIEMNAASLTINGGEVTANGNNNGIYAYSYSNITINGGQVTATGGSGIFASQYSTLTISGGQVTATGNNRGLSASQNSTLTISGGQVTATGNGNNSDGILSDNSTLTISGGQVTATGNGNNSYGILSSNGTLTISGGQVTANGNGDYSYGITTYYRAITLGWTNYSDFIYANSYHVYESTINIAEGKTFITDDGNTYTSGELTSEELEAIAGKKLYPYVEGSVPYIDENGQRQLCTEYIPLTGNETEPLTTGWYVADNTLNFTNPIMVSGHVHLILKDNAVMNVGTEEHPIDDYQGIGTDEEFASLSIYAQSTGEDKGQLNVYVNKEYASGIRMTEDLTINGGQVTATVVGNLSEGFFTGYVTINGGQVTANGGYSGIISFSVTINGGQVTANGGQNGILSYYDNITLGWTNPTDFIYANSYDFLYPDFYTVIVKEGKTFITDDATPIQVSDTISDLSTINGKTLYPYVAITKSISGHNNSGGWYLIASPVAEVTPAAGNGFLSNEYDLYRFNPSNEGNEWENYKAESFNLVNGQGYLYANSNTTTLVFAGVPVVGDTYEVALEYDANDEHQCWNLVGNPFGCNATLNRQYYVLSTDGTGINPVAIPATTPIPPCTAVFVKAVSAGDTAVFSKVTQ